ncbi:MAG: hypothetical protein IID42_07195 [Planctomycetes bacterium]|nr:hypothetical protein [Planctomycetota bacterium]
MNDVNREELSELLSGYLDGELNDDDVAVVERVLLKDQDARKLLEELRQMVHVVGALPRHDAPPSIAEDIAAHMERSELLGDADALESVAGPKGRSPWSTLLSMAAGIAVVASGVLWYTSDPGMEPAGHVVVSTFKPADNESSAFRGESPKESRDDVALKKTASLETTSVGGKVLREGDSSVSTKASPERRSSRLARKNRARDFAGSADARSDLPAVSVSPLARFDREKLLASLNVEQILVVDGQVSHLRKHPFHNEKVQLAILARDTEESGEFARRLVDALESRNVVNAATSTDETALTEISKNGFFLQGASGINYRDERQEQILVYVTASDRDALLDEIGRWSDFSEEVELQVGPIRVRGLASVREALHGNVVPRTDKPTSGAARQDLKKSAGISGPNVDESTAEPGFGLPGLFDMVDVLVKAGERNADGEDTTSGEWDRMGTADVYSKETGLRAGLRPAETGQPAASPVINGGQPQDLHGSGWKEPAKAEGISGTGSLVEARMKDLKTTSESRAQNRRRAGQERAGDVGRAMASSRRETVRWNIEPDPERFVTLVFQIIPQRPAKAKVSKRSGSAPLKKAKASNGRSRVHPKRGQKDKPVRK